MTRLKHFFKESFRNRALIIMALPGIILVFMFNYMPMFGISIAFKSFNYGLGIMGSPWCGLANFKMLITNMNVTWRIVRNTLGYYFLFTAVGTVANVALAIALYECVFKRYAKVTQTIMIMPTFISFIAVTYIVNALLNNSTGMFNSILKSMGKKPINWYLAPQYWPTILTVVNVWKGTGYGSIMYLSALSGMDQEIFEAAQIDGATKGQQIRYITLPMLTGMICILLLLGLGGIMHSNTGLHYQVTKNVGLLYSTTQTIDAFILNALTSGTSNFGMNAAVTFFQSVVGCVMVVVTNLIVRRWDPDKALF